jgi:hypothetical protein
MAGKSTNEFQPYVIALIVFVLLTFVLAVSNYFAYKWGEDNRKLMEEVQKEREDFRTKMRTAINGRKMVVGEVLGLDFDDIDDENLEAMQKQNDEIVLRKKEEIDVIYGKSLPEEQRNYAAALKWLGTAIKTHDAKIDEQDKAKQQSEAEKNKVVAETAAELKKKDELLTDLQSKLEAKQEELTKYQEASTEEKNKLVADKKAVEEKLDSVRLLAEEIAKCKDYLSSERKSKWPVDDAVDVDIKRIEQLLLEMREKDRTIARLNQIVSQARIADRAMQDSVLAATPKDDRIDGFDGRILSVNELDRTVLLSVGATTGIRAGLIFYVYDPVDPQPQISSRKGVIEVVAIESGSLVRARVRSDSTRDPILPGDVVATSLWAPDASLEVVLVGVPQFGGESSVDAERFKRIVERIGGTVETAVTPATTIVVDGGIPRMKGIDPDREATRKPMSEADKKKRDRQLDEAKRLGIKVVAMEPFLAMMGLQLDAVGGNSLPVPADRRAAPARPENVAY